MYIPLYTVGFFRTRDQTSFYCVTHMFFFSSKNIFKIRPCSKKRTSKIRPVLHFFDWLIFHFFFFLFFRITPLSSSAKSNEKLVNQKYAALFLSWMPGFIFWQFSLFNKFTGVIQTFCVQLLTIDLLSRGSKLKRYMVKFNGNFKRKTSTPLSVFFLLILDIWQEVVYLIPYQSDFLTFSTCDFK